MSKFIKLLKTTLEKYGYIPSEDKWYEFNELINVFEEKEYLKEFLEVIESEKKWDSSSSVARLLRWIIREWKIINLNLPEYLINQVSEEWNDEHFDATLIDIFFELEPLKAEKEEFTKKILEKKDIKFPVYEALLIHTTKYLESDSIFAEVYLRSLNAKRWTYLWVHWFQDAYVRIAKSPELSRFIETIISWEYGKAFERFIEWNEDTLKLFFENIPPTDENFEIIKSLLTKNATEEDPINILSQYHGYNQKVFLDAVFNFLSKSGKILPYIEPFLEDNYGIYETREYVGNYIHLDEVSRLWKFLWEEKRWWIMPIYEYIKSRSERTDKDQVLQAFEQIPGFDEEIEKTRLSREKYEQEERERIEQQNHKTLEEIKLNAKIDTEDTKKISPLLIDLYKKDREPKDDKKLFIPEQIEIVKEHLKRFFAWELFPLDKVEFTRTKTSPWSHSYSYTNNIWYREWFFLDALKLARELWIDYPSHDKLVRGLALLWIDDEAKRELIPAINSLSREDIETLWKVYDGTRTDQLCEFMWWQNFFEIYRAFESDWKREKDILRKILYAFIEKHEVEDYVRERALELLSDTDIWDEATDKPFIEWLWEKEIPRYPENIVENYERKYSYLLSINQLLINIWDEDAINWRFDQLLNAKVDFPDPWEDYENNEYARWISDLESELSHDKSIIKWLENISFSEYESKFLHLYRYWLELLNENKVKYEIFGSYLLWGVIEIWKKQSIDWIVEKMKAIVDSYPDGSEARRLGWYKVNTIKASTSHWDRIQELEENIKKLKFDIDKKDKALNWNPSNPYIVFIEWKTGVEHLKRAWEWLMSPDIERRFHIANWYWADQLLTIINNWEDDFFEIIIGLFDADDEGLEKWWWKLKNRKNITYPSIWIPWYWEDFRKKSKIYWLTTPIHLNISSLLLRDPGLIHNIITELQINHATDLRKKRFTAIEEMYYGITWVPDDIFDEFWRFTQENTYWWNKWNLLENLIKLTKEPNRKIESEKVLFKNFEPLFEKINKIIDDHEKSKQQNPDESVSEKSS